MFKPSTVLIQSDLNGGNDNLFDAVQDYLFQSSNKNKNYIEKEFQSKNENINAVVNKNENRNEVLSQIDDEMKGNDDKIFFKKKLKTSLLGNRNRGEIVNINDECNDFIDLNKNKSKDKKRKILSVDNLARYANRIKQEIDQKKYEKIILGNDKMEIYDNNYDKNNDSGSNDINFGNDDATNNRSYNNDNEHNNIDKKENNDSNNHRSSHSDSQNVPQRTEHTSEDVKVRSLVTDEARINSRAGASAELYLIHRYVRYCGIEISPTCPVMFIALLALHAV